LHGLHGTVFPFSVTVFFPPQYGHVMIRGASGWPGGLSKGFISILLIAPDGCQAQLGARRRLTTALWTGSSMELS